MVPYYEINADAALPDAFAKHDLNWAKYLVAIGALSGMTTSLVRMQLVKRNYSVLGQD